MTDDIQLTAEQRRLAWESPLGLARVAHPEYESVPVHQLFSLLYMNAVLSRLYPKVQSSYRYQVVAVAPRMTKSETFSVAGAAWALGRYPHLHVVSVSYESGLSEIFGRQARNLLDAFGPQVFGVQVNKAMSSGTNWGLTDMRGNAYDGSFRATSVGGSLLGRPADILVLDDCSRPGDSKFVRDQIFDWYFLVARPRLNPGGSMIIVGQRIDEDDLPGRVMREEGIVTQGGLWLPTVAPLWAEPITKEHIPNLRGTWPDPLGRKDGEILWPGRYSDVELAQRKQWPSWVQAAILQCRPTLKGGTTFSMDSFHSYQNLGTHYRLALGGRDGAPEHFEIVPVSSCKTYFAVDLATSLRTRSDLTAILRFDVTPSGRALITDLIHEHFDAPSSQAVLESQYRLYDPNRMYVEKSGFQLGYVQTMRAKGMSKVEGWARQPGVDKQGSALTAAAEIGNERILIPEYAPWLRTFTEEVSRFPLSLHDDIVDALSIVADVTRVGKNKTPNLRVIGGNGDTGPERGWTRIAG
jgi:predicted phage terminase large subunit-like protein